MRKPAERHRCAGVRRAAHQAIDGNHQYASDRGQEVLSRVRAHRQGPTPPPGGRPLPAAPARLVRGRQQRVLPFQWARANVEEPVEGGWGAPCMGPAPRGGPSCGRFDDAPFSAQVRRRRLPVRQVRGDQVRAHRHQPSALEGELRRPASPACRPQHDEQATGGAAHARAPPRRVRERLRSGHSPQAGSNHSGG